MSDQPGSVTSDNVKLFHVTRKVVHESIVKVGVDPIFSRGKMQVSWWVDQRALAWAIAHVSLKDNIPVSELEIWTCKGHASKGMKRTRWVGVYMTPCRNKTFECYRPEIALECLAEGRTL